jgi:hypothetical protein
MADPVDANAGGGRRRPTAPATTGRAERYDGECAPRDRS